MSQTNPKVDEYLGKAERWPAELKKLRGILCDSPLVEDFKWGKPCYRFDNRNVAILYSLKGYCAVGFLKGALIDDPYGLLEAPGANSQSNRWIGFTDVADIDEKEPILQFYIRRAVENEKAGLKVDFKEKKNLVFPPELTEAFEEMPDFEAAFLALTPGRQRGYNLFFSQPKQSKTRTARIDKHRQRIFDGKGMHDR